MDSQQSPNAEKFANMPSSGFKVKNMVTALKASMYVTCSITLLVIVIQGFQRFAQGDSKAIVKTLPSDRVPMIAFTVCPAYKYAYKDDKLEDYGLKKNTFRSEFNFSTPNGMTAWDVLRDITYEFTELVEEFGVSLRKLNHATEYFNLTHPSPEGLIVGAICPTPLDPLGELAILLTGQRHTQVKFKLVTKYWRTFGRCYSIQLDHETARMGITTVRITSVQGLRLYIYVHTPGQFHEADASAKTLTSFGIKNYIDMTYSVNIDRLGSESETPCQTDHNFDFDDCLYEKAERELLKAHGCTVPFLPPNTSIPICVGQNKTFNQELKRIYTIVVSNQQRDYCGYPCLQMPVVFGTLFDDDDRRDDPKWGNRSYIQMYLKSVVRSREAVWDFPAITMLAEYAGYSGILFGISVVDLTAFMERICKALVSLIR